MDRVTNPAPARLPLDSIRVGERVRKDFQNLKSLAASIRRFGLLHPIVVNSQNVLVAGERRLRAVRSLGWKDVEVHYIEDLSEDETLELELEENLQRENLTWQETLLAKKHLFDLREKLRGTSVNDFADELGESHGKTSQDLALARELLRKNPVVSGAESKTKALFALKSSTQKRVYEALAEVLAEDPKDPTPAPTVGPPPSTKSYPWTLRLGDTRDLLPKVPDSSVACVITDPPFGVKYEGGTWDDSWEKVAPLLSEVFRLCYSKLMPDSTLYCCFGLVKYRETIELLTNCGFRVNPLPIIVEHKKSTGHLVAWDHSYSPWLYCKKGNRLLDKSIPLSNFLPLSPKDTFPTYHPTAKPTTALTTFIRASTEPGELVLDPFAGSGSTLLAATLVGRKSLGFERDSSYYYKTKDRLIKGGDTL